MKRHFYAQLLVVIGMIFVIGCSSTSTSNTARTAKEQLLLSNAVDQSLDKVDFSPLKGQKVFLEEKYLECVDKNYVVGSIRHRIMRAGAHLAGTADDADVVMEVRSGGVGTDTTDAFLGTPEFVLPGMLTLPEVRFIERKAQFGYSKLAIATYDAKTKQALGDGGMSMARSDDNNWNVFGFGPFQDGTLKSEIKRGQQVQDPQGTFQRQMPMSVALKQRPGSQDSPENDATRFASESKEVK